MNKTEGMVKIRLRGPYAGDVETLWAVPVGVNLYRLDNSPFFAYGVSWQDVVEALPSSDQFLEYVRCIRKSGNRTLRIIFQDYKTNDQPAQEILRELKNLGCSYEGMQPRMISVNVPPGTDLDMATDFLAEQSGIQWEYADPTYEDIHGRKPLA